MKKTNKLFFTMCMVGGFAVLFGSCKKKEEAAFTTVNLPAFEEEVDGRAYIDFADGNKFKWNANDEIMVYNLDAEDGTNSEKAIYQNAASAQGQATARFEYASGDEITAKKYGYFVFYPAAKVSEGSLNELNYETFTVGDTQVYSKIGDASTVDPEGMAMAIDVNSLDGTYTLKHIFGVLKLKIFGEGVVSRIEVIDERFNLSGSVSMKLHEVKMDKFTSLQNSFSALDEPMEDYTFASAWDRYKGELSYSAQGTGKMMTLDVENGVALNGDTETNFYIGLRPGALKYGFTVKVYLNGENEPRVFDYTGNNNIHYGIKAGKIKSLPITIIAVPTNN
jgi:hypothetical protein